jgi:formimidoylglutamate deiminase
MPNKTTSFFAAQAWVNGGWARDLLLTVDANGLWRDIQPNTAPRDVSHAVHLAGPVLPAMVNAHSHAFQRAIAGLTERRSGADSSAHNDNFWSWRQRMYCAARRVSPEQLENIATQLYAEMLAGGYTQVCEFHYLHNAADGQAHADPIEMSLALVRAAQRVGMGLTLLPTLYMRAGFGEPSLHDDQHRFASTPDSVVRLVQDLQSHTAKLAHVNVGIAVHSLRAADAPAVKDLTRWAGIEGLPIHIHVSEQTQEVQDCLTHTGQRPIEWLLSHLPVNAHWNLVHATHTTPAELAAVRASGAAIVICPSTEANLGDGVFDYPTYARLEGRWSIGSDSHVTRRWTEELRLLEYAQRLTHQRRNVAAQQKVQASSAAVLFEAALAGGQSATSQPLGAMTVGNRADFLVLDEAAPALLGVPTDHLLDALVFSSPDAGFKQVFVAGQAVQNDPQIAQDFVRTMQQLWA